MNTSARCSKRTIGKAIISAHIYQSSQVRIVAHASDSFKRYFFKVYKVGSY